MRAVIEAPTIERRAIRVRGAVQGVGFRPFVHRLARELGLTGWVLNDAQGVAIEAQGPCAALEELLRRLAADAPPLARVEAVEPTACSLVRDEGVFSIRASVESPAGAVQTAVPADAATCAGCLAELFDPADRRYRYAFVNCTHCGPRYTLTRGLPYDRAQTSMAPFALCERCLAEYRDPDDRRFHAEPNACAVCGPRLALVDLQGRPLADADAAGTAARGEDPVLRTLALLRAGAIVAIKGLGGYHLACDARRPDAVAELRRRKQREEKPFAVMAAGLASALDWVQADAAAQALLASAERPVVLLPMRSGVAARLQGVAPGLDVLGMMLPCTPIQHLLFHEAAGRPAGTAWQERPVDLLLVMTSANPGGEPIVTSDGAARSRLADIADAMLTHDREIVARCDDSVLRLTSLGAPQFVRRARGYTPRPIRLPRKGPPVLATGAWLKNTVCLTRGDEAFLSPHVGDLDHAATCDALDEAVAHLMRVLDVRPRCVAHDLHPDFYSSRFAAGFAAEHRLPCHAVQHHHAHVAAVAAEHGVTRPLLGLALDGVGLGDDGQAWGGELLLVDGAQCRRLGHLRPLALPGGDAAAREPWRAAAAVLHMLGRGDEIERRFAARPAAPAIAQMLARAVRCPPTTSGGRWFDAAAALLGVREVSAFEGQAAMQLEALARIATPASPPPGALRAAAGLVALTPDGGLDPLPLLARLVEEYGAWPPASSALAAGEASPARAASGAALFHLALADGLARWVRQAAESSGLATVALSGGCFLNALLSSLLAARLRGAGIEVLEARQAPPNDGGIALGQAWVAMCLESSHASTGGSPRQGV